MGGGQRFNNGLRRIGFILRLDSRPRKRARLLMPGAFSLPCPSILV
jgi:hypothetical protein